MAELGAIRRINAREIWANEAGEFTPWLADHLDQLGEALGAQLELVSTEAAVGDFAVDILARDLGTNRLVVIENQLTSTDHDHLGKLLTYASGHDAGMVVWIAPEIRDEHRQALDWLNQRTDVETGFFGVSLEIIRIDESKPAIQFRLAATPNTWRKERAGATPVASPTGRAAAYQAFFQALIDELREKQRFTTARRASPTNWTAFASGVGGIGYNPSFARNNQIRTEIYIDLGEEELNKRLFDALAERKTEFEARFGEALSWERLDGRRACRIAIYRPGSIDDRPEVLAEHRTWFIDRLLKLKKVFGQEIATVADSLYD